MGSEQSQLSEYVDRDRVASWLLAVAVIRVPQCGNNDPPEGEHHAPAETRQSNYQIISNNHLTPRAQPPASHQADCWNIWNWEWGVKDSQIYLLAVN